MPELAAELAAATGGRSIPPRSRAGSSATATASKKTLLASEQDRPDISKAREEWRAKRQPRMRLEPHRLVFIDETGTTTKMTRLRGRCLKGQRLRSKAPFGHWKTQTFIAGLRCHGLTAPFVVDAPMNRRIFETYVETQLAPTLQRAMSSSWTICRPQKPGRRDRPSEPGRMAPLPAALQPRPQPDRNGLRQAQSPSARKGHQDHRRPLAGHRRYLRSLLAIRMQKLLHAAGYGLT